MKHSAILISLSLMLALFSCEKESMVPSELSEQTAVLKGAAMKSTVNIEDHTGEWIPGASSTINRNNNGISVNFKTKELIPGNAYTMWFVVFGDAPGPPILVTYAAGHIASGNGNGNFSGHLSTGDIFNAPMTAEVHLALRSHGPAQPGIIPEQIQTLNGGCTSGFATGPVLHPDSETVGYCANVQVAIHDPGN